LSFPLREADELTGASEETTQPIPAITRGLGGKSSGIHPPGEQQAEHTAAAPRGPARPERHRSPSALSVVRGKPPAKPKAPRNPPQSRPPRARTGRVYRLA